jgi:exodeoxyribonuclease V gamma subunit
VSRAACPQSRAGRRAGRGALRPPGHPVGGLVRARGRRGPDPRDGALTRADAVDVARREPGAVRWRLRERRVSVPGRLVGDAVAAASGIEADEDRWLPERAVWPLLKVVGACLGEPWLRTLSVHLDDRQDPVRRARRLSTVRHLAELFARYALHRPEMLRAWANSEDDRWQAELWRRLRERIGQPSPAERLEGACAAASRRA